MGGGRGRLIPPSEKAYAVQLIEEAVEDGARHWKACETLEISRKTFYRWKASPAKDGRKGAPKRVARKLTEEERQQVLQVTCSDRFKDCTPKFIEATLLDEGNYIASASSIYRVLSKEDLLQHRRKSRAPQIRSKPEELTANGPNQVWSWDITYLRTDVNGIFLYCYMIVDIWSRKIVGWEIHDRESPDLASQMFRRLTFRYNLEGVKLRSDNGNPMKGATMLMTLYSLGVIPSFSRPRVSDDNPFSESLFKTVKYTAGFPKCFQGLPHARRWMAGFVNWYNTEHKHSGIGWITPEQRHNGESEAIFEARNRVKAQARDAKPERWSGPPQVMKSQQTVTLNATPKSVKGGLSA